MTLEGTAHTISQADGGEQGDPLMPALYSLGVRDALAEVQAGLEPNELLLAYPARPRPFPF